MSGIEIRAARPGDWASINEICCETGRSGDPIDPALNRLFADLWIKPYRRLAPDWTLVAGDGTRVLGYLTGCPDTARFEARRVWRIEIPLRLRLAFKSYGHDPEGLATARRVLRLRQTLDRLFGRERLREWQTRYPAHLHMNLRSETRGRSLGRQLVEAYAARLSAAGVAGAHLFCGDAPLGFYRRVGFEELGQAKTRNGATLFCLGRRAGT